MYYFKKSFIHGHGCFAERDIEKGEKISLHLKKVSGGRTGSTLQRTDVCMLTNHDCDIPNVTVEETQDGDFYMFADVDIKKDEELLVNYFFVFKLIHKAIDTAGGVIHPVISQGAPSREFKFSPQTNETVIEAMKKEIEFLRKLETEKRVDDWNLLRDTF